MAYWEAVNEEDERILRELGKEPGKHEYAVHRVGKDFLTFLHFKTREEILVTLYERNGKDG